MNGKEILVDTNILLYLLKGNETIEKILQGKRIYISFITELELIGFKDITDKEEQQIASLLNECAVIYLNNNIKLRYKETRKRYHLKLADAVIAATAAAFDIPLITADKQFKTITDLKLVAYEV
jgi:Predicted nucleic acid-binding protein, contains PIN domain